MTLAICPNGHPLTPGRIRYGWAPCMCDEAWAAYKGHRTLECSTCSEAGGITIRYEPPHLGGGHPGRGGSSSS